MTKQRPKFGPNPGMTMTTLPLISSGPPAAPMHALAHPQSRMPRMPLSADGPWPGGELSAVTLRALARYAIDMVDVRYLVSLAESIGAFSYSALQDRHLSAIMAGAPPDAMHKYLDVPYWVAHKLAMARTLGLLSDPPKAILDLGTGAGHLLRIAVDHGHTAIGIDIPVAIYADVAELLGVDRRIARITRYQPLPDFGRKFDIVTAIWTKYDDMGATAPYRYWQADEWAFQLNDIVATQLLFPGRIYFVLNDQLQADGRFILNQDMLSWFEQQGAKIDRSSGAVDLKLAGPQRFGT
jgi:hypothetical protein